MSAIGNLPPGFGDSDLDAPISGYSRHMEALHKAEETIPCPSCQRKDNVDCGQCHGTTLLPATRAQFEAFECGEVARDLRELALARLAKVPSAIYLHSRLYRIVRELEMRSAA